LRGLPRFGLSVAIAHAKDPGPMSDVDKPKSAGHKEMTAKESLIVLLAHIVIPAAIFGLVQLYGYFFPKTPEELALEQDKKRKELFEGFEDKEYHPQLTQKIAQLDSISTSLNEVLYFIDYQKRNLLAQEATLQELVRKNKELEPVVKTKQELIDAIFRVQDERNRQEKRIDQLWGFVWGVISSIVATGILHLWSRAIRRNRKANTARNEK
jgi:hypothetical protein